MNIYIHVEISVRELDSKLLLAAIAASKGHQVIVSDLESILSAINKNILSPGIFLTKSLTPTKEKIIRHQMLKDKGFLITSIDEEAGLDISGYQQFSITRFSEKTIEQSSKIFCWGNEDVKNLKKKYPQYSSKIFKTGSPRVDLWRPSFAGYWNTAIKKPKKPFLLVSSNMALANNNDPFYKVFIKTRSMNYLDHDPQLFDERFNRTSEQYLTIAAFIKAIRFLSENSSDYDIVLRPHPTENIEAWKAYLDGLPNVHVIREDSISAWVNSSFAVMHNGCTTAFETTISEKPLISYVPYEQKYTYQYANQLGHKVHTEHELLDKVNEFFKNKNFLNKEEPHPQSLKIIFDKLFIDHNEYAAEKIVKELETLDCKDLSKSFNLSYLKNHLRLIKIKKKLINFLKKFFPFRFGHYYEDLKFQVLDQDDISKRINNLKKILKLDESVNCTVLSDRTILIKKN